MAFKEWVQSNFIQPGVASPLIQGIKLIFKNPNNKPFKKATVQMYLKNSTAEREY